MQNYELTIVLPGKATAAKKKDVIARIEKMVNALGGRLTKSDDWGVKDLAYKIAKNTQGAYLYFELEMSPASVSGFNEKIKMEGDIIRYLLVKHEARSPKK